MNKNDVLQILDLKLTFDKEYKCISVDVLVKATNSFTYILPSTFFRKNSFEIVPKGVAWRLANVQYQKYLVARDYIPSKVKKQFSDIRNISREEARRPKNKNNFAASCNLITQYNLLLPPIIKKYLPVLHSSHKMLQIFPENTVNVTYRRNKNLKELISSSLIHRTIKENNCSTGKCNRRYDICTNVLVLSTEFTYYATKRKYKIRGFLTCSTKSVVYLIA